MRRLITSNIDDTENDDDENITEEDDIDVEIKEEEREIARTNTKTQFANFSGNSNTSDNQLYLTISKFK